MKTIMIVDDADAIRKSVMLVLGKEGYGIVEATDGADALKKLAEKPVDLIICDVNMPVMDGFTFIQTIINDGAYAAYKFTPVLMLTTEIGQDKRALGTKLGIRSWIVKPFKPEELVRSVKLLLP